MSKRAVQSVRLPRHGGRRCFPEEFNRDAEPMLLDGVVVRNVAVWLRSGRICS